MTRPCVAVIDVGSNSIKLLVASLKPNEEKNIIEPLCHHSRETRISAGISHAGHYLSEDITTLAANSIQELCMIAQSYNPEQIRIVATSAVRDAANRAMFAQAIAERTGIDLEIFSGHDEALSVAEGIQYDPQMQNYDDFFLFDLGGGSTELIRYENKQISQAVSLQLGAVRVMEHCVPNPAEPMTSAIANAIQKHVQAVAKESGFCFEPKGRILIGTGGAITVARALLQRMHHRAFFPIPQDIIETLFARVAKISLQERITSLHIPAKRADIFPTALATILTVMRLAGTHNLYHSYYGLRFGVAAKMLEACSEKRLV